MSAVTQWRRQLETRAFFSWLLPHDHIASNPFMRAKNIKVPQKIVQPFSLDDVQRLLGHSTSVMLRRYTASYDAENSAQAHASFSPGDSLGAAPVSAT